MFNEIDFIIDININYKCSRSCFYCYMKTHSAWNTDLEININELYEFLYNLNKNKKLLIKIKGGEPTESKNFNKLIKKLSTLKNSKIEIFTHGLFNKDILNLLNTYPIKVNFSLHLDIFKNRKDFFKFLLNIFKINHKIINILKYKKFNNCQKKIINFLDKYNIEYYISNVHSIRDNQKINIDNLIQNYTCYYNLINIDKNQVHIPYCLLNFTTKKTTFSLTDPNLLLILNKIKIKGKKCFKKCKYIKDGDGYLFDFLKKEI